MPPSQHLVISVIGQKGGSGKTSTAYNLSGCYRERGFPVWVIDTDPQQSLAGILAHAPDPTAWQIIAEGREAGRHALMGDVGPWLRSIVPDSGIVIIDTPPALGSELMAIMNAAVRVSDRLIVPTNIDQQDIHTLLDTVGRLPQSVLIVANNVLPRTALHKATLHELRQRFDGQVSTGAVPSSIVVKEAAAAGRPVVFYRKRHSVAAIYRSIAEEVLIHGAA